MTKLNQKTLQIVSNFQSSLKDKDYERSNTDKYTIGELIAADEQLGDRDTNKGYRLAIKNKITELESVDKGKKSRNRHCNIVAINNIVPTIGIIVAIFLWYFS